MTLSTQFKRGFSGLILLMFCVFYLHASSISVSGNISSNTTWSVDTVFVNGDITVDNGITLSIDPGVIVLMTDSFGIHIQGRLLAQGAAGDSIRFTMEDTSGYSTNSHTGWGGIRFNGTSATNDSSIIDHCIIEFAQTGSSSWGGGFLVSYFNKLRVSNSSILYCTAYVGGAFYIDNSTMLIKGCLIAHNRSTAGQGGGIASNYADGEVKDNRFYNNTAASNGGAADFSRNSDILFSGNLVQGNSASAGGGLMIFECDPVLSNNTITDNTASSEGGAMVLRYSSPQINGNYLANNTAAVASGAILILDDCDPELINNVIIRNQATYQGGIKVARNCSPVLVNNTIAENTSTNVGACGLSLNHSSTATVTNSIIMKSSVNSVPAVDALNGSSLTIMYSNIEGILFPGTGNLSTDPLFVDPSSDNFRSQAFSPGINTGTPDTNLLGLPLTDLDGNARVYSCSIDMGAYESQSNLIVGGNINSDTTWSSDTVYVHCDVDIADGATLTIDPGVVVMMMDSFRINVQGRLLAVGAPGDSIVFTTYDTIGYAGNTHTGWQGIHFDQTAASNDSSILHHCILEYAKSTSLASAIYVDDFDLLRVSSSRISNCIAYSGLNISTVSAWGSDIIFSGNCVRDNVGTSGGGIGIVDGSPHIRENKFIRNHASSMAGAIYMYNASPQIVNNLIEHNTSAGSGGALTLTSGSPQILRNTIRHNTATGTGGAFWCNTGMAIFTSNLIANNTALSGGGLYVSQSTVKMRNNLVHSNTAQRGGAFKFNEAYVQLYNNTIVANTATTLGGAIHDGGYGNFSLVNNNIWGNTAPSSPAIYLDGISPSTINVSYTNIQGGYAGTANIDADPHFVDPANHDYRLLASSPAINAGNPSLAGLGLPADDLDSNARVYSCAIDIGAYESQSHLIVGGTISSDTSWSSDTVYVHCDVDISDGATLTIDPGVVVMVMDSFRIKVEGRLLAQGTAADSIHFQPMSGLWGGLRFDTIDASNDSSIVDYTVIRDAGKQFGGGIWFNWTNIVRISNSTILSCQASVNGGAIAIDNGSPVIRNNTIRGNTANGLGGGLFTYVFCEAEIRNNFFYENQADEGGGLFIGFGGNPVIEGNTIRKNSATYAGGIEVFSGSNPDVLNNRIDSNLTSSSGAGLLIGSNSNPEVRNNAFISNISGFDGGGIVIHTNSNPLIQANTFISNRAVVNGASITIFNGCSAEIRDNSFTGDSAGNWGGSIYGQVCTLEITGNLFKNNTAGVNGGALAFNNCTGSLSGGNEIHQNHAGDHGGGIFMGVSSVNILDNIISENTSGNNGAGIYMISSSPEVSSNMIYGNQSGENGGGLYLRDGSNPALSGNTVHSNYCQGLGAAINMVFGCSPTIMNDLYYRNESGYRGGAVYADFGSSPVMTNVTIANNKANDDGGGLACSSGSNAVVKNSILFGNTAGVSGDNVYLSDNASDPEFQYSNIEGGSADFAGVGSGANYLGTYANNMDMDPLFVDTANGDFRLLPSSPSINAGTPDTTGLGLPTIDLDSNSRVYSCAIDMGAYEAQSNLIVGGSISSDTTWSSDTVYVHCDVIIADGVRLTIDPGVTILFMGPYSIDVDGSLVAIGNPGDSIRFTRSSGYWSGFYFDNVSMANDTSVLDHCVIEYASKNDGGAMYIRASDKLQLSNSLVRYCSASARGGGIFIESSSLTFDKNIFYNNSAGTWGGALYFLGASAEIRNHIISNNTASTTGGAFSAEVGSNVRLINLIGAHNQSGSYGGFAGAYGGSLVEIVNSTILGNSSYFGGGLRTNSGGGSFVVRNMILRENTGTVGNQHNTEPGSLVISYSNVEGGFAGTGNVDTDPLFHNPAGDDFRLQPCSPMINAGDPDTTGLGLPPVDAYGQLRIKHDTVDIGAAEFNGSHVPIQLSVFDDQVCYDQVPMKINGTPAGGTFSGTGVAGGYFYPAFAGPGFHNVVYNVDDSVACPTTDTITIEVLPLPVVSHGKMEVCEDELYLSLIGGTPSGGSYSGTYVSGGAFDVQAAGVGTHSVEYTYTDPVTQCSRTISVDVCVNPLPVVDFPDPAAFCVQSGLNLLTASPSGGTFSGTYVTGNAFDTDASGDGSFTVYYHYADSNSCVNVDSATITVLPQPTVVLTADASICPGECVTLSAGGGVSYSWSTGYDYASFNVCPQQTTTYTVTVTGANGCTASDNVTITVKPLPMPIVGSDDTICPGETVTLGSIYANKFYSYSWSNGGIYSATYVSPVTTTTYYLTVTNRMTMCSAVDSVTVFVHSAPVAQASFVDTVCPFEQVTLTASGGGTYAWNVGGTSDTITEWMGDSPATFTVTVTDSIGCTSTASVTVPLHSTPDVDAGPDQLICLGDSVSLTATGGVSYEWQSFYPIRYTPTVNFTPYSSNSYDMIVVAYNEYGCSGSDIVNVNVHDSVGLVLSGTDTIQPGDTAQLAGITSGGLAPYTYSWSPMKFVLSATGGSLNAIPVISTDYTLEVVDANGCVKSRTHRVNVDHPGAVAAGRIFYDNLLQAPMSGVTVHIKDSVNGLPFDSTLTNEQGYFWFNGLDTTTYSVIPQLEGRWGWGGVNSVDAQIIGLHFVQQFPLSGISLNVADVNQSFSVNSTDAAMIVQRFVGNRTSFPAGDWYFSSYDIPATGEGMIWPEIPTRVFGDVNGSYFPTMKATPKVWMGDQGMITADEYRSIGLPVRSDEVLEPGSISLVLQTELASHVSDVRLPAGVSGELLWNARGDELRIGWFSLDPMQLLPGDALFYLEFDAAAESMLDQARISVTENSELSDASGNPYSFTDLYLPKVYGLSGGDAALVIYPNPASDVLYVEFSNPEAQMVEARLYDVTGRVVRTIQSGMLAAGEVRWEVALDGLSAGSYQMNITTAEERLTKKVVVIAD